MTGFGLPSNPKINVTNSHHQVQKRFQLFLRSRPRVQSKGVAGSEIESNGRIRMRLQIDCQYFLGNVVVLQAVVTKGHVNIQCQEFSEEEGIN